MSRQDTQCQNRRWVAWWIARGLLWIRCYLLRLGMSRCHFQLQIHQFTTCHDKGSTICWKAIIIISGWWNYVDDVNLIGKTYGKSWFVYKYYYYYYYYNNIIIINSLLLIAAVNVSSMFFMKNSLVTNDKTKNLFASLHTRDSSEGA